MASDLPARPDAGEIAGVGSRVGSLLAPYIGEISADPRTLSGYRQSWRDDLRVLQLYRDTLRDEQCYATFHQRLDAAISVPWEVQPGGEMRRDKMAAKFLEGQLMALDFNSICRQMLHGLWYGYAVAEAIWTVGGGRIGVEDIRVRAPDRFRWEGDRDLMLRTWESPWGNPVPDGKFWVLARPGEHGDVPHGLGLGRWCYWPAWMRRNGQRFWAVALEKFGTPTPMGSYPKGDDDSRRAVLSLLAAFANGAGVAVPDGQKIELLQAMQRAGGDFEHFAGYMDKMIAKVILGQSATTEQGPWRGTAEVQKDVRDEVIASDCRLLGESFTSTIATWLTHWNFPGAAVPRVIRDASPPEDLDQRAEREEKVARMSGLRPTEKHIQDVYGGEWEVAPEPAPVPPDREANGAGRIDLAGEDPESREAIALAVEELLAGDGWEPLMEPIVEPALAEASAALARGDSLEDFRDRSLPALFERMDDAELVRILHRMAFSAALSGDAGLAGN